MTTQQKPLEGKVALVTGAGQGIGRAIALGLAQDGAAVVVNSNGATNANAVTQEILALGGKAIAFAGNVGEEELCSALVELTTKEFGSLDILVNNAGITRDGLLMRMKTEDWNAVIDTNLKSAFLLSRGASKLMMKKRWGRIINITSIVGIMGNPGQANYCASKAGMIGLTKSLAKELASRNILVNAVAPGFIATRMTDELTPEQQNAIKTQIPLDRFGAPEDIASVVQFLAGDKSGYITGQVIEVTGGMGM
ncbi:MAG: 3-oxoacyl-[acyl-carrier-protein] reductase [Candidatus Sumerlaeia bacterium]|nr:3-oxoacyl-[acyl-carrier-protein] reductase [Candidatus Sumerlaeia bacterium]